MNHEDRQINLVEALYGVIEVLDSAGIEYALCGGLAMAIYGLPRATRDIDLLIREEDLDAASRCLESIGFVIPGGMIAFHSGTPQEHRALRVSRPVGSNLLTLDLLLVATVLDDVWQDRVRVDVGSREITVVSRDGFAKMKRLAGRKQDLLDLENLGLMTDETE